VTITAVGAFTQAGSTTQATLAVSPTAIGDIFCLFTVSQTSTISATSVSGGGVTTWNSVIGPFASTPSSNNYRLWYGVITATGASTITVTWSSAVNGAEIGAQQFHSTVGTFLVDTSNTLENASSTTVNFPSLTPVVSGEIYFAYAACFSTGVAGSTTGYIYQGTPSTNMSLYNPSCTASVQSPTCTQTTAGTSTAIAMMIRELVVTPQNINQAVRRGSYY
jgi:hypothetical protein